MPKKEEENSGSDQERSISINDGHLYCDECDQLTMRAVECEECDMTYCWVCDKKFHVGKTRDHMRVGVGQDRHLYNAIRREDREMDDPAIQAAILKAVQEDNKKKEQKFLPPDSFDGATDRFDRFHDNESNDQHDQLAVSRTKVYANTYFPRSDLASQTHEEQQQSPRHQQSPKHTQKQEPEQIASSSPHSHNSHSYDNPANAALHRERSGYDDYYDDDDTNDKKSTKGHSARAASETARRRSDKDVAVLKSTRPRPKSATHTSKLAQQKRKKSNKKLMNSVRALSEHSDRASYIPADAKEAIGKKTQIKRILFREIREAKKEIGDMEEEKGILKTNILRDTR